MITHPTSDSRIRIAYHGPGNWRIEIKSSPHSKWAVTGPAYPNSTAAGERAPDVLTSYFGEPSRAELARRIEQALSVAREGRPIAAGRVIELMCEALTGEGLSR